MITVEEGSLAGGFGSALMERCEQLGIADVRFHSIGIPDEYVHHGGQDVLRAQYDLHPEGIAKRVREFVAEKPAEKTRRFLQTLDEIWHDVPDETWKRMHDKGKDSSRIDEVITGRERVASK